MEDSRYKRLDSLLHQAYGIITQIRRELDAARKTNNPASDDTDLYEWFCAIWPHGREDNLYQDFPLLINQFNDGPRLLRANLQSWLDNDSQTRAGCRWARSFLKSGVWQRPCQQAGAKPQRRRDAFDELLEGQQ